MHYLYGNKTGAPRKLVATFDTEEQLLAYVNWATLYTHGGVRQFEKGSRAGELPPLQPLQRAPDRRRSQGGRP